MAKSDTDLGSVPLGSVATASRGVKPAGGASIKVDSVFKKFGAVRAIDGVSLDIVAGEFLALLGPSGSGKTSLLMSIAGFDFPDDGRILIGNQDMTYRSANKRNLGMVFQKYTLFPHLSVQDNVAFPLKMRGVSRQERAKLANDALAVVRLSGFGGRMPAQLSGGQQQRVALARAIVYRPQVLLMDEPLSALDKNLREEMQLEIKHLQSELGLTVVFVTHDQSEALAMADRIAVLKDGKVQQIGSPDALYDRPKNLFVAGFMGEMNFLGGHIATSTHIDTRHSEIAFKLASGRELTVPVSGLTEPLKPGDPATVAIRPEHVTIATPDHPDAIPATVRDVIFSGPSCQLISRLHDGSEIRAWRPSQGDIRSFSAGAQIGLVCSRANMLVYAGVRR